MRRLGAAFILAILLLPAPAVAAPWWWVQFTKGDDVLNSTSAYERWMAFAINDAAASETVYVASFTWGSGQNDPVSGLSGANNVGMNAVAAARAASDASVVIMDDSGGLTDTGPPQRTTDSNYLYLQENPTTNTHHNKLIVIGGRRVVTGSANFTAGAYSAQPNNMLVIRSSFSGVIGRYVNQMEEFRNGRTTNGPGVYHDNTASGGSYVFNAPNGDTVEVYFSPDDNGNIPIGAGPGNAATGSGGDLEGVVIRVIREAKQSVFYGINATNMDQGSFLPNPIAELINGTPDTFIEGWLDNDNSTGSVTRGDLQADHTSRDANSFYTDELHHKFLVADQEVVVTGSPNLTSTALSNPAGNDENMIVVHDFRLGRKYLAEYRRVMSKLAAEAVGQADSFDSALPGASGAPDSPGSFSVTATDTAFYAAWTAATAADITRYFLFIDTAPLTQAAIGDFQDNDGDGLVDEDPRGDADGFPSGTTAGGAQAADDDADGSVDEDPWLAPEVQVKGRASTSGAITTWNVGDALAPATNYYFAIVSVDTHGNESLLRTFGPLTLGTTTDTRLIVAKNSDTGPANAKRGETNVVAATLRVRGDTTGTGDTLAIFEAASLGLADSQDVVVRLWRDENRDSRVTTGTDTLVATLAQVGTARRWRATLAADSRTYLGSGASAGRTFLVTLDVYDTATLGETFQVEIAAQTCSAVRSNSGPASAVTNTGAITIVSANPLDLLLRGDYPSASIPKGTTDSPVMSLRVTVGVANDTLQVFRVRNIGTMTSADVSAVRLYHDGDADSVIDAAPVDTLVATLSFLGGSDWGADTIGYRFAGDSLPLIVSIGVAGGATGGRTFQGRIVANTVDAVVADTGPPADRTTTAVFTIPSDTGPDTAIVINEFIPDPNGLDHDNDGQRGDTDEEFVELYNNSDLNVDVGGWKLDDDLTPGDVVLPTGLVLGPRQFLVVYNDTQPSGPRWFRYDSAGIVRLETGTFTGTGFALNNSSDTVVLFNDSDVQVDSRLYTTFTGDSSHARLWDGAETWTTAARPSPGKNADPTAIFNNPSPNAVFALSAPSTANEGDSFTITITARNRVGQTIAEFNRTAALSVNTGTISPGATGSFAAGTRSESVSITNVTASGSVTITARYNSTTSGTVAITVNNLVTCTFVVDLEARTNESGCSATITGPTTRAGLSDTSGMIVFANIPEGTYTFTGKHPTHLRRTVAGVAVSGDTTVTIGLMRAGDSNDDNWISIFDAARVKWFSTHPPGPASSDIDGDSDVDATDLQWVRQNFGRRGDP